MAESYFSRTIYPREVTSTGDDTFSFDFDYISPDDVRVSIDGNDYLDFTLVDASTVKLDTPLTEPVDLAVYRSTFLQSRAVDFVNAAELSEKDLDNSANQVFFAMQEAYDLARDSIKPSPDGSFSLGGRPLKDVGLPLEDDWAATKGYVDSKTPQLEAIRDETAGLRDETVSLRDDTQQIKNDAVSQTTAIRNQTSQIKGETDSLRLITKGYMDDTEAFMDTAEAHRNSAAVYANDSEVYSLQSLSYRADAAGHAQDAREILDVLQGDQVQYTSLVIGTDYQAQTSGSYHIRRDLVLTLPDAANFIAGASIRVTTAHGTKPTVKVPDGSGLHIQTTKGNDTEVILDGNVEFIFIYKETHWEV